MCCPLAKCHSDPSIWLRDHVPCYSAGMDWSIQRGGGGRYRERLEERELRRWVDREGGQWCECGGRDGIQKAEVMGGGLGKQGYWWKVCFPHKKEVGSAQQLFHGWRTTLRCLWSIKLHSANADICQSTGIACFSHTDTHTHKYDVLPFNNLVANNQCLLSKTKLRSNLELH